MSDRKPVSKDHFDYLPPEVTGDEFELYNFSTVYTPTTDVDFKGDIVLLTDHVVYSAAEGFTNFCKSTGFATTMYGTTSGDDGFFVFPTFCVLPNSKLVINMSSSMSLDNTGHANEEVRTQPDVYYESALGNQMN